MALPSDARSGLPVVETYDYSLFGEVEVRPLNKIRRVIARRLHASWVNVPMVVQFDEADITELEALRAQLKPKAEAEGVKLTVLAFIIKACVLALKAFPDFNASLDATGENLVLKKYCHIGFATDTPNGLIAPVIKDADKKSLFQIAAAVARTGRKGEIGAAGVQRDGRRLLFRDQSRTTGRNRLHPDNQRTGGCRAGRRPRDAEDGGR